MRPERREKILNVAYRRQLDLTVILENVHDPHNIGAAIRSCDAIGIAEVYILFTEPNLISKKFRPGKRTTSGARNWVKAHIAHSVEECCQQVRRKYDRILATCLDEDATDLFEMDLTGSCALVFGNENQGVSNEMLDQADGTICIPQVGMVKSLNISVACAVTLYEAFRQRNAKGYYDRQQGFSKEHLSLIEDYLEGRASDLS